MPKVFTSEKQKIGEIGENIACKFLVKHGFSVLDRNYTKKWGEIDIVAEKEGKLYFIEVKSVSRETLPGVTPAYSKGSAEIHKTVPCETLSKVSHETNDNYRAEDNMHPWKMKRLSRTIQTYLLSKKIPDEKEWQIDLLVVYLDLKNKKARVKVEEDIIL